MPSLSGLSRPRRGFGAWWRRVAAAGAGGVLAAGMVMAFTPAAQASTCTTSSPDGTCGPYTYPRITGSNGNNTYVRNNMWAAKSGTTQTLNATDPGNWNVVANAQPPGSTAVQTYPDTKEVYTTSNSPDPLSGYSSIYSSFTENMNATSQTSAQAAYDIWLGQNTATNYADEVMIWNDQANRGTCGGGTPQASASFGGSGGVPMQTWNLCKWGSSELIWYLAGSNEQSGTVDVLAMLNWLVSHGYLPQGTGLNEIDYGFEICSTNGAETFQVSSYSITATPAGGGGGQVPAVTTAAATGVTSSAATLNGTVNPESQVTTYHFEYGTTASYGTTVPVPDGSAGSGGSPVPESANLTGLVASTTYHYRLDATNATGTTDGPDHQFTTGATGQAPVVVTNAASGVTSSGATLNGSVNPENQSTTYHFEYGTSTSYGTTIPVPDRSAGSGGTAVNENAAVTGLAASTTYHYRLDATNATGTTQGSDQQFTTSSSGAGGSVAFGAVAPGSGGAKCANCTSLSWNASVSGSHPALLAEVAVGAQGDGSCTLTVTDNGTVMTRLSTVHDNSQTAGYHSVYGMTAPPSGTNAIAATVTGCTPQELTGGSLTFTGASQTAPFGTPKTATGSGSTAQVTTNSSTSGNMVAGFVSNGSAVQSPSSPATARFTANQDDQSGAGNSAGATAQSTGSNVTMKWSVASDWWGVTAVEVLAG